MPNSAFVFTSQSGCLLPTLIILNLFFGRWLFNSTGWWLGTEAVLIFLFIIKLHNFIKKITLQFRSTSFTAHSNNQGSDATMYKKDKVIDVDAEEVQDRQKLL
ncbi:MAG: hypothetical protein WC543_05790 [Candidatus Omnitrophota bacterium]